MSTLTGFLQLEMPYLERVFGNVMATVSEMCRPLPAVNPPNGLESASARAHPLALKTARTMCRQMKFPMQASCANLRHLLRHENLSHLTALVAEKIHRNIEIISQIEKIGHVRAG